ncbi:MAG: MBL fold metallo-hydrolase [Phycisphaerae bacterium]|nr:MBL fold metallo-hydrolase [Phycisphaerae bacterium]
MDLRVISIGCLDANSLWGEKEAARSGHATTTLIRSGDRAILVDPGLPAPMIEARLAERANLKAKDITHVFLTCFRPDVRRGLPAFESAVWWISGAEREGVGVPLIEQLRKVNELDEPELSHALELDVAMLKRCDAAPDQLAEGVSLFPMPGVTPGMCGLVIAEPRHTTLICGDAVPTVEHLERGQVVRWAANVALAQESFKEAIEIADLLILGRDNLVVNPVKRPF